MTGASLAPRVVPHDRPVAGSDYGHKVWLRCVQSSFGYRDGTSEREPLTGQITLNWRGRPLTSHQVIVDLITNTKTATGLSLRAVLDTDQYPTGISYSDKDIAALPLVRHDFHGDWNYTLLPNNTP